VEGSGIVTVRRMPRWPLWLIASPAAVAVWSGWVALGSMCGFGPVNLLPGVGHGFTLDTAITLPVGVEAYGAYALGAWLVPGTPERARVFARRSAIGALLLGMGGQVIYHLLAAAHAGRAPWPVVVLVSSLPVVTLGFGAALTHLLHDDAESVPEPVQAPVRDDAGPVWLPWPRVLAYPQPDESGHADGVDRAALVAELAEQMRDAIESGDRWQPDYPALMARTGYRRSWCEKAVREARTVAFLTSVRPPVLAESNGHAPESELSDNP
jgi:hypothetical protein